MSIALGKIIPSVRGQQVGHKEIDTQEYILEIARVFRYYTGDMPTDSILREIMKELTGKIHEHGVKQAIERLKKE